MFNKKSKRRFSVRISENGGSSQYSSSSGNDKISSDEILAEIQWLYERNGEVVVDFINDEKIELTSLNTVKDDRIESKLNEIKRIIRNNLN